MLNIKFALSIQPILHHSPNLIAFDVGESADATDVLVYDVIFSNQSSHQPIEHKCNQETQRNYDIELKIYGCTQFIRHEPQRYNKQIDADNRNCGANMRKSQIDKQMVEMRLVGMEWRLFSYDS